MLVPLAAFGFEVEPAADSTSREVSALADLIHSGVHGGPGFWGQVLDSFDVALAGPVFDAGVINPGEEVSIAGRARLLHAAGAAAIAVDDRENHWGSREGVQGDKLIWTRLAPPMSG